MRHLLINCARTADLERVYRYMRPRTGKPDGHLISERTLFSFVVRLTNRRSPIVSRVGCLIWACARRLFTNRQFSVVSHVASIFATWYVRIPDVWFVSQEISWFGGWCYSDSSRLSLLYSGHGPPPPICLAQGFVYAEVANKICSKHSRTQGFRQCPGFAT